MSDVRLPIVIPTQPLGRKEIDSFRNNPFAGIIKFAVDIAQERVALGGEMNADAEALLLETGSRQEDLWGGNLLPWSEPGRIEYTSLINIRASADNPGMEIASAQIRKKVDTTIARWVNLG